ncbi:MAG: SpoIIE family protein phosphatase [candidate division WOR-3 bacterium]
MTQERPFKKKFGLRLKFALWTIFFVLIMLAGVFIYFINRQINTLTKEMERNGVALATSFSAAAKEPFIFDDDLTLVTMAANVRKSNPGILYCVITDTKEIIKAHPDSVLLRDKPFKPPQKLTTRREVLADEGFPVLISEGPTGYDIRAPIVVKEPRTGKPSEAGYVHFGFSKDAITKAVRETLAGLISVAAACAIIGILGIFLLTSMVVRGIVRLTKDIEIIGRGDLSHPVQVKSRDEVGLIAHSVEVMARNLKEAQARLLETERFKHEVEIAQRIQAILLPRALPRIAGHEVSAYYQPALVVGGDYYDFFRMAKGKAGFIMADVAGKGVGGSLIMVMTRTMANMEAAFDDNPKDLLVSLHEQLRGEIPEDMFVTACAVALEPETSRVQICSAGHNPSVLFRASVGKAGWLEPEGAPLGISLLSREQYSEILEMSEFTLLPGDAIVLYTDGVTEAMNEAGDQFGEGRLLDVIARQGSGSAVDIRNAIVREIENFTKGAPQSDDITLMVIKRI